MHQNGRRRGALVWALLANQTVSLPGEGVLVSGADTSLTQP